MMMQNEPNPVDVAKQLLAIESIVGSLDFLPADRNPLPALNTIPTGAPAPAAEATRGKTRQAPAPAPAAAVESLPELSLAEKVAALSALDADEVKTCTKCSLHRTRTNTVFGEVNPNADLVFVGEAPGADEDATGRPFVGRAGELLTKMIGAMGLTRDDVFICNTLKCRPPGNRPPGPDETKACWSYLLRQLQIIRPKVIVTLGNPATKGLLATKLGITKLRGQWQRLPNLAPGLANIPVMPTFHPSYIVRLYTPENRAKAWSDLQQVMQQLGLPLPKKS